MLREQLRQSVLTLDPLTPFVLLQPTHPRTAALPAPSELSIDSVILLTNTVFRSLISFGYFRRSRFKPSNTELTICSNIVHSSGHPAGFETPVLSQSTDPVLLIPFQPFNLTVSISIPQFRHETRNCMNLSSAKLEILNAE